MGNKCNIKYTKELLEPLVKNSYSLREVIRKLGLKEAGGTYSHIGKLIDKFELDKSHFFGKGNNRGEHHKGNPFIGRPVEDILKVRLDGVREKGRTLSKALTKAGVSYSCSKCNLTNSWLGSPIVLEVDHINNDWSDNRIENLRFLCPNCHSQEDSMKLVRKHSKECPKCGCKKQPKSKVCGRCSYK